MPKYTARESDASPVASVFSGATANIPVTLAKFIQTGLVTSGDNNDLGSVLKQLWDHAIYKADFDYLVHLTRDLIPNAPLPDFTEALDSEIDLYAVQVTGFQFPPTGVTLTDANFDNQGADINLPDVAHVNHAIYARLPIAADRALYRLYLEGSSITGGLGWTSVSGPDETTYTYWHVTSVGNAPGNRAHAQTRDPIIKTTFIGALGGADGETLAAVDSEVDALQHLTRDIHAISDGSTWATVDDADADIYVAEYTGSDIALTDAAFNGGGATGHIPALESGDTGVYWVFVRLPIGVDHAAYRVLASREALQGNTWVSPAHHANVDAPESSTYQYWFVESFTAIGGNARVRVTVEDRGGQTGTRYDGEASQALTLRDHSSFPSVDDFDIGYVAIVDEEWYELGITHATLPNRFEGTIGRETFRTVGGDNWRGIATAQSPNGFSTDGGWTANPDDALSLLLADDERHLRVGIRRSVFVAAKGSAFASTDKIAIKITYADASTEEAVMAYYNAYSRLRAGVDEQYILFQHRKTTGNYAIYGADTGAAIAVEFFTVDGDGNATTTPLLTHAADQRHWIAWSPVPVDPDPDPTPDPDESSIGPATEPHTHHSSGMDGPSLAFLHGGYDYLWLVRRVFLAGAGDFNEWLLGRPEGTFPPDGEFKQITNSSPAKLGGIGIDWLKKGSDLVPYIFGAGASVGSDDHVLASRYEITNIDADPRDGTTLMVNSTDPAWGSHAGIRFVPSGVDENDVIRDMACYQEDQENHNISGVRFWLLNTTKNRIHNLKGHTNGTSNTLVSADTNHPYLDLPSTAGEYSGMALQRFGRDRILHVWHQQAQKTVAYDVASGRFWRAPDYDVDMSWVTVPHGAYAGGIEFNDAGTAIYTSFWDKDSSDPEQFRPSAAVSYINRKDISTYEFGRYHMDTALGGGHASGVIAESTIPGQPPIDLIKSIRFRLLLKRYGTSRVISTESGTPTDQMRPVLPALSRTDLITSDLFIPDNSDKSTRATDAAAAIAAGKCLTLGVSTDNNTPRLFIGKTDREAGGSVQGTKNDWFTRARVVMWADGSGRLVRLALADVNINGTWWYNWVTLDDIEIELLDAS